MDLQTYLMTTTQAALAEKLGVTPGLVHQWLTGRTRITGERAVEIEYATHGKVLRHELRPDIFGPSRWWQPRFPGNQDRGDKHGNLLRRKG